MKQIFNLFQLKYTSLLFIFILILFLGCGKKHDFKQSTDLNVTIEINDQYSSNTFVGSNVNVNLYKSRVDMETRLRPVASGITNSEGKVVFNGLEPFSYFIHAYYEDSLDYYDNSIGNNQLSDIMVEGALTVVKIPIYYTRPSSPTSFTAKYIEILKYDTQKDSCSRDFFVEMDDDNSTLLDVTDTVYYCYDNFNTHVKYATFNNHDPNVFNSYGYFEFTLNDTTALGQGSYSAIDTYYFYPVDYEKGNYNNYPSYPTRLRLWEANPTNNNKNTIDLIISWQ
jgi:hypothetical protein